MHEKTLFKAFLDNHKVQLESSGVPEHFWPTVFHKVTHEIFDSGVAFSLLVIDYEGSHREETSPTLTARVCKADGIKADEEAEIYLVDHAWTFRWNQAREVLLQHPQLIDRMGKCIYLREY